MQRSGLPRREETNHRISVVEEEGPKDGNHVSGEVTRQVQFPVLRRPEEGVEWKVWSVGVTDVSTVRPRDDRSGDDGRGRVRVEGGERRWRQVT